MEQLNFLFTILIINLISHLIITIINLTKINFSNPLAYKILAYFPIFILNIITLIIILFINNTLKNTLVYSYITITMLLFIMHYIFDEDFIFRFNKFINFLILTILSSIFYSSWSFLMF